MWSVILVNLDPMADILLELCPFLLWIELGMAPAWIVAVIICRELAVTVLRLFYWLKLGIILAQQQCLEKLKLLVMFLPLFSLYYIAFCLVEFYFV